MLLYLQTYAEWLNQEIPLIIQTIEEDGFHLFYNGKKLMENQFIS